MQRRLFRAMRRDRYDLFRFVTRRETNCFRAERGSKVYAAAASVIATGRRHRLTALEALEALWAAPAGVPVMRSG
jgi:hypothetical protein